jgi:hypothetical protein
MNNMFVYRGILVRFDEKIGWFFYDNENRFDFSSKNDCLDFIRNKKSKI